MRPALRITLVLFALSLLGLAITGESIYARLAYLWFFLVVGNYLLSRMALKGIEVQRVARLQRASVGDVFEETFDVRNRSRMPHLWLEVRDEGVLPGARGSRVLSLIGAGRTRSYVSRNRLVARGVFPLGPTRLSSGDLFGFFPVSELLPGQGTLTVFPQIVELHSMPHLPGYMPGGEALRRRTHQITPNAATVREYSHGDPLSRIHWASTARRDRLIVKEFELDPLAEVWIFIDAEQKSQAHLDYKLETDAGSVMFQGFGGPQLLPATEEYTASIAASLAKHYLQAGRSVGMVTAAKAHDVLPADRGARQLGKIMETLSLLKPDGDTNYLGLVVQYARTVPRGSTLIMVTPSVSKDVLFATDQVRRLGLRPIVVLLDALSFGGAAGGAQLSASLTGFGVPNTLIVEGKSLAGGLQLLNRSLRIN
jgi:uncharacterized protein (DUF58 family)